MATQKFREHFMALCSKALAAKLELKELHDLNTQSSQLSTFQRVVLEDLEDATEHMPGFFLRQGVDLPAFQSSELYRVVRLDLLLLATAMPDATLLSLREYVRDKCLTDEILGLLDLLRPHLQSP